MTIQPTPTEQSGRGTGRTASATAADASQRDQPPALACASLVDGLEQGALQQGLDRAETRQMASLFDVYSLGRMLIAETLAPRVRLDVHGDHQPSLVAWVQLDGSSVFTYRGQDIEVKAGNLCLLRSARPQHIALEPGRLQVVALPETEVADRFPLWRQVLMRPIPVDSGIPALFVDAIRSLSCWQDGIEEPLGDQVADTFLELMGAVICSAVPDPSGCLQRSLHQRQQVKRYIQRHLQDPGLNAEKIAGAMKLSVRQVHRLFADESVSLMRWIWTQRLEACHRELERDPLGQRSLADIAYAWGFNDQAHFSRAFRRQFGLSPSELRRRRTERSSSASRR